MENNLTKKDNFSALENVVINGDLSSLTPQQRMEYYAKVCGSMGLNPMTKPFDYIKLNGKLTLYAKRDATDQLRKINKISVQITSREKTDDVYVVSAQAKTIDGRTDESVGAVSLIGLKGDALANALMKAETKAKRRVTLSICGLGLLDETEVESIKEAESFTETPQIKQTVTKEKTFEKPVITPKPVAAPKTTQVEPPKLDFKEEIPSTTDQDYADNYKKTATKTISPAQVKRLYAIAAVRGWTGETVNWMTRKITGLSPQELTFKNYESTCEFFSLPNNKFDNFKAEYQLDLGADEETKRPTFDETDANYIEF